jgi:hypothetical protein
LQTIVSGLLTTPSGIAVDATGGKVYWTESALLSKTIGAPISTAAARRRWPAACKDRSRSSIDGTNGKLYWTDNNRIQRANLNGSSVQTLLSGLAGPPASRSISAPARCTGRRPAPR